jgi:hypothetical protein
MSINTTQSLSILGKAEGQIGGIRLEVGRFHPALMQIRQVASRCLSYHAAVCFPDVFIGRDISAKIPFELDVLITLLLALL